MYFDYNDDRKSWVIRDFIMGRKLDNHHSRLSVADIEADAVEDEFPPWLNVTDDAEEWRVSQSSDKRGVEAPQF